MRTKGIFRLLTDWSELITYAVAFASALILNLLVALQKWRDAIDMQTYSLKITSSGFSACIPRAGNVKYFPFHMNAVAQSRYAYPNKKKNEISGYLCVYEHNFAFFEIDISKG